MKILWVVSLSMTLLWGCGETGAGAAGMSGNGGTGGTGGTQSTSIEITEASFDCILDGTRVRNFYVKNLIGDLEGSLAVANGEVDAPYPPGTLLQLVPQEAMVKREAGFSPETRDWEFFFLMVSASGSTITARGKDETENAFGGNCFTCHSAATDNDFVCETGNGCDPLTIDADFIEMLRLNDPRCE